MTPTLQQLLTEYDRSLAHTDDLIDGLSVAEIVWRPHEESSAIGWHLGHQAAVAHFMVRNLTAAEPSIDVELDRLMDSATLERERGDLPDLGRLREYRTEVAERVRFNVERIDRGDVGAPSQLRVVAAGMVTAIVNHEYQHSQWIGETRTHVHGRDLPERPRSEFLSEIDGYLVLG
ncbi:MAG: DinB family protein [Actinomycetota bacterium]